MKYADLIKNILLQSNRKSEINRSNTATLTVFICCMLIVITMSYPGFHYGVRCVPEGL